MRGFGTLCGLVALSIVGVGVFGASRPVDVYGQPEGWTVARHPDDEGTDRIYIYASGIKHLECDLESGNGPPWVDFSDDQTGVPPPSALYRPDGVPAGRTVYRAGERWTMDGYSAVVPLKMRDTTGTAVLRIPCQVWEPDAEGGRVYGRKVVAEIGPFVVPPADTVAKESGGTVVTVWRSRT